MVITVMKFGAYGRPCVCVVCWISEGKTSLTASSWLLKDLWKERDLEQNKAALMEC